MNKEAKKIKIQERKNSKKEKKRKKEGLKRRKNKWKKAKLKSKNSKEKWKRLKRKKYTVHCVRVFANGQGDRGSIPGWIIPMTQIMDLDTFLLNKAL